MHAARAHELMLMRALRKHALNYLDQLWILTSDRRHEKDTIS